MSDHTNTTSSVIPAQPAAGSVLDLNNGPATEREQHSAGPDGRAPDDLRELEIGRLIPERLRLVGVSGTYIRRPWILDPTPASRAELADDVEFTPHPEEIPPIRFPDRRRTPIGPRELPPLDIIRGAEDLRVDVDGWYPQNVVSGTITRGLSRRLDWYARVARTPAGTYRGAIAYRNGDSSLLPQTTVDVALVRKRPFGGGGSATATFSGGSSTSVRTFTFSSSTFHPVAFEYDTTSDSDAVTTFETGSHPNRPADLPIETVSIEKAFRRAGFDVTKSGGDSVVPVSAAGSDKKWTEQELNDAMATYWSAYTNAPAWAAWGLFAGQSIDGPRLGGIMFDYTGSTAPQRQGCVVFSNSFISDLPSGDPDGAAWVRRMRFWTAVHEFGHAFNLAHAWDKSSSGWIPTADESHLRSFMNYPHRFAGGASGFFSDFRYRFSDSELLFMRHAPERFVRMGGAAWFTDHGFSQANTIPGSPLLGQLRAHRPTMRYEFLEPVTLELKLENTSSEPMILDAGALDIANCTIIVQRRGGSAKSLAPYSTRCLKPQPTILAAGAAMYGSVTVSSGREGWILSDPGDHLVQVAVHLPNEDVVTPPVTVRVLPPMSRDEEVLAQDLLTPEVGRVLAAGGTRRDCLEADTLREAVERLPDRAIAAHSRIALGRPLATAGQQLVVTTDASGRPEAKQFVTCEAAPEAAVAQMGPALEDIDLAADTFGHIAVGKRVTRYAESLVDAGRKDDAVAVAQQLHAVLRKRGVKASVLENMTSTVSRLRARS